MNIKSLCGTPSQTLTTRVILSIVIIVLMAACERQSDQQVVRDEHFNSLFHLDSGGVTGADGTISIALPDGRSVFMMGDSFLGKVENNRRDPNTHMMNNSFIVVNDDQTDTRALYQGTYDQPRSFLVPPDSTKAEWYWPGHGFARDSVIHLFMSEFWKPREGQWGFEFLGTDYLRLSYPGFEVLSREDFSFTNINQVHWGHAVVDDGDYVYIYGSRVEEKDQIMSEASAHVMRAQIKQNGALGDFMFFNGSRWVEDPKQTRPMKGIGASVSEQFSVFQYKDQYVLLTQQRGMQNGKIFTYVSRKPTGPWGNETMIHETTEQKKDSTMFTYNAMAHPQYIKDGRLLVCYNLNSLHPPDIMKDVRKYRPRFLRVPMEMILE